MSWKESIRARLDELRGVGLYRELLADGDPNRSFSHNDYLGLSTHPRLLEQAREGLGDLAGGSTGSRLLGGNREILVKTEERIAEFFHAPAALFFTSGYLANQAIVTTLAAFSDHIFCDENIHASLIDGVRLAARSKTIVPHGRWAEAEAPEGRALIVAESLYSMDGDTVDAEALVGFQKRSNAFLILDEAHAMGVFDKSGLGLSAGWRNFENTAITVTFGKAFGVTGAAILCSDNVKEAVINSARSFIYTTAPSPWVAALVLSSLEVMREEGLARRSELWDRARDLRAFFQSHGLGLVDANDGKSWDSFSPILPLPLPGNDRALRFASVMREFGWSVKAIRYPTVARGTERIRISLSLQVSRSDTQEFAKQVVEKWKAFL